VLPHIAGIQVWTTVPSHWLRWSLMKFLPGLALNHNPLDLSLPRSYDYRLEPARIIDVSLAHISSFCLPFWTFFIVVFFLEVLWEKKKFSKRAGKKSVLRLFTDCFKSVLLEDYKVGTFNFKAHLAVVTNQKIDCLFSPNRLKNMLYCE
jgi:hypothetical protein